MIYRSSSIVPNQRYNRAYKYRVSSPRRERETEREREVERGARREREAREVEGVARQNGLERAPNGRHGPFARPCYITPPRRA